MRFTWRDLALVLAYGLIAYAIASALGCASVRNPDFNSCRQKPSPDCQPVTVVLSNGGTMQVCDSPTLDKDIAQFNENMREASGPTIVEIKK